MAFVGDHGIRGRLVSEAETVDDYKDVARTRRAVRISVSAAGLTVCFVDLLIIVASSLAASALYELSFYEGNNSASVALGTGIVAGALFLFQAHLFDLYRFAYLVTPGRHFSRLVFAWLTSILLVTALLFLFRVGAVFSRGAMVCFASSALGLLCLWRVLAARALHGLLERKAITGRRVVVIGEESEVAPLGAPALLMRFGLKELARFTVGGAPLEGLSAAELAKLDGAVALAREQRAEELVIALDWSRADLIRSVEERLRASPLPVRLLPDRVVRSILERQSASPLDPLPTVELQRAPLTWPEQLEKRACDIVLAALALVILSPLMLMSALAVRLDSPGPVIFRQRRAGFDGATFAIYKFRTMRVMEDGPQVAQTRRNDPRVTRVGRLLRQSSIDELPQLFNVLKGDMALVGPRPHALAHDDQYRGAIASYAHRHHVKPGITGWAQVNGQRGETRQVEDMERRVELDLWYIDNWSLTLDLRILWRTCFELARAGAY